ncbi:hypothetical protein Syun_014765 [Stephania yunnanensis]|uniref:Uncharacterized protein n=1 Tax=Stephania yunnanensis TaxID=152371 RepID=A0AAP0JM41_9MAGN
MISHDDGDRTLELPVLSDSSVVKSNIKLGVFSNSVIQSIVCAEQIVKPLSIPFLWIQTLPLALLKVFSQSDLGLSKGLLIVGKPEPQDPPDLAASKMLMSHILFATSATHASHTLNDDIRHHDDITYIALSVRSIKDNDAFLVPPLWPPPYR